VDARGDERDVGDVGEVVGVDGVGGRLNLLPVDRARIRGVAGDDDVRLELLGGLAEPLVVDVAGVGVDLVLLLDLVDLPGEVRGVAVREVAAVVQIEREDLVAGIEYGVVDRLVRLRSGVRLDVDVVGAPALSRDRSRASRPRRRTRSRRSSARPDTPPRTCS